MTKELLTDPIESARPFDPNDRPRFNEWVDVDREPVTAPNPPVARPVRPSKLGRTFLLRASIFGGGLAFIVYAALKPHQERQVASPVTQPGALRYTSTSFEQSGFLAGKSKDAFVMVTIGPVSAKTDKVTNVVLAKGASVLVTLPSGKQQQIPIYWRCYPTDNGQFRFRFSFTLTGVEKQVDLSFKVLASGTAGEVELPGKSPWRSTWKPGEVPIPPREPDLDPTPDKEERRHHFKRRGSASQSQGRVHSTTTSTKAGTEGGDRAAEQ